MKHLIHSLMLGLLSSTLIACAGRGPVKEVDTTRRIQAIALTDKYYIYAQDDIQLDDDSINKKLGEMNIDWKKDLSRSSTYQNLPIAAFITQLIAVGVCAAQDDFGSALAWCGGSLATGLLIGWPLNRAAAEHKHRVIEQYNRMHLP